MCAIPEGVEFTVEAERAVGKKPVGAPPPPRGNWCYVIVTARWGCLEGSAYLGCCLYKSEEDFKGGGYYEDLKKEAFRCLLDKMFP